MISLFVIILTLNMIYDKLHIMATHGDNQISSYYKLNKNDQNGFNLSEANLTLYHVIRKKSWKDGPVYLSDENLRYMDVYFSQSTTDWKSSFAERVKETRIEAR